VAINREPYFLTTPRTTWTLGANQPKSYLSAVTSAKRKLNSLGLLAIPAFTSSLSSVTDTLSYNWDFAYANEFLVVVD
jgi:hypothetical protein